MTNRPRSVSAVLIFIIFNALVWLALGIIIASNAHPALPDVPLVKGIMAFLALAIAGILSGLFVYLGKRSRIAYFSSLGLLAVISVVTIFDQFGWVDLVILIINVVPLILLIKDRAWYLQGGHRSVESN
jgi:hypothetical protein